MHYSKSVLTVIFLTIAAGVYAQSQEIEGDNIQEALYIKNAGSSGITVFEPSGDGIVIQGAGFKAGYFTTSITSTSPGIVVGQQNSSKDYHDIRLTGSRIIGSTENILIDIDSDTGNTSEDHNFFGVIRGDKSNPVFLVDQEGNTTQDGNISAKRITASNPDDTQADLQLGGASAYINASSFNSNLKLESNGSITVKLGKNNGANTSKFVILDNTFQEAFSVDQSGNTRVYGTLVTSDRNKKEHITKVAPQEILHQLIELPIYKWNYKKKERQHLGPMAQDFLAAFNLGQDDTTISSIDADGISLSAIIGLYEIMKTELEIKSQKINELESRLSALEVNSK